jgi:hypothetical protein
MIKINNQEDMIEVGRLFLHQETTLSQEEIYFMEDFDVYYNARDLIKLWNSLPKKRLKNKKLALKLHGIKMKNYNGK